MLSAGLLAFTRLPWLPHIRHWLAGLPVSYP
jgi:hypothetical protein